WGWPAVCITWSFWRSSLTGRTRRGAPGSRSDATLGIAGGGLAGGVGGRRLRGLPAGWRARGAPQCRGPGPVPAAGGADVLLGGMDVREGRGTVAADGPGRHRAADVCRAGGRAGPAERRGGPPRAGLSALGPGLLPDHPDVRGRLPAGRPDRCRRAVTAR